MSVAMGDVDGDNVLDLVVGAGKGHTPDVVVYSGKGEDGEPPFGKELARFAAFDREAQGGISVTSSQIDGSTADNIIVGSGPGIPSEVKVFSTKLPSTPGTAPELFSAFNPYIHDQSGVSVASGFVDFTTGRYSIVTAPGPGTTAHVKIFSYSLMKPIGSPANASNSKDRCDGDGPALTGAFLPFGLDYRGGLSLASGWLTGSLGGAEAIVVGQLTSPGVVKVYSSGSMLDGGPKTYLRSAREHSRAVDFTEVLRFKPFGEAQGVSVATTSTEIGADLLVSGAAKNTSVQVLKYRLARPTKDASTLIAEQIGRVASEGGSLPRVLGGD